MIHRRTRQSRFLHGRDSRPGYSLVELIIALTVAVILLLLLFSTFQNNTLLARTQIDVAKRFDGSSRAGVTQINSEALFASALSDAALVEMTS